MHKPGLITMMALGCLVGWHINASAETMKAPEGHLLDWLQWARTRAQPYLTDIRALADGNTETVSGNMGGPQTGGVIQFAFPDAVHVTALRLMQRSGHSFELRADPAGEGTYAEVLGIQDADETQDAEWIVFPVDRNVQGLQLTALSGSVGYRASYPSYRQIEIYTRDPVTVESPAAETAPVRLDRGEDATRPELNRREIAFTPCIDLWMAGIVPGDTMPETVEEIESSRGFQNLLAKLRDIDAQGVRMFLETYCGRNRMPWISNLAHHYGRDTMRGFMEALHNHDLTGSLFLHAWISPFQPENLMLEGQHKRWDYPYEQSDLLAGKGLYEGYEPDRYPCVISDSDFRTQWFGLMKEFVELGGDGVYVMPDEYYFKGHNLDLTDCPACERNFKARFGYDGLPELPPGNIGHGATPGVGPDPRRVADTTEYRKFKLFEYEKLAELFNGIAGDLNALNPDVDLDLISCGNPASVYYFNRRIETGMAFDIIGRGENFTGVQLYGSVPLGLGEMGRHAALARRMRGSHRHADLVSSIQSLGFKSRPDTGNEIMFYGYVLPHIMSGASKIDLYRLNYVEEGHGGQNWWRVIQRGIAMVRLLEEWGIVESASAAETAVLRSRASEDWWYIRAQALLGAGDAAASEEDADGPRGGAPLLHFEDQIGTVRTLAPEAAERAIDFERFRGPYSGLSVESLLVENGIQYDVLYTEREDSLNDLARYRLLVLPFSYSMSAAAFEKIRAAVESGTRLLIYDQLAPTDEYGDPHPAPLLQRLLEHPNVTHLAVNLAVDGMSPPVRAENRRVLLGKLGDETGYFNANGMRVEFISRKTDDGMLLYLANWDRDRAAAPVLGLPLPDGQYRVTLNSSTDTDLVLRDAMIGGQSTPIDATALRRFSLTLDPGEVLLAKVQRIAEE